MRKKYFWNLLSFLLLFFYIQTVSAQDGRRVLFISSYHPGFSSFFQQVGGIRDSFKGESILLDIEFLDSKRFPDEKKQSVIRKTLEIKLKSLPPYDAVITGDDNASVFAYESQNTIFKNIPIVFLGVNSGEFAERQKNNPQITGIAESVSIADTIILIKTLHNEPDVINIISDSTSSGRADLLRFRAAEEKFPGQEFNEILLDRLSWEEYCSVLEKLDQNEPVLFLSGYKDKNGDVKSFEQSLDILKKCFSGAVYHLWYHGIGSGMLGGKIISHYEQGKAAAGIVLDILSGKSVNSFEIVDQSINKYVFDYNEVRRLGFSVSDFPSDSIFLNKPFSFFKKYRVLVISVIFVFTVLTAALIVAFMNIIVRKRAQAELKKSRDNYKITFHSIGDAVISTDMTGIINNMNHAAENLTGWKLEDAENRHYSEVFRIINSFTGEDAEDPLEKVLSRGEPASLTDNTVLISKGEEVYNIADSCSPVKDFSGKQTGAVLVFRDVSESHMLHKKLDQQSKLDAIGQLAGGVAHDYNNQLAAISGYAELLVRKVSNPVHRKYAENILRASKNGAGITNNLLSFARMTDSRQLVFDLNSTVSQVSDILIHTIDKRIKVKVDLCKGRVSVFGDPVQLQNAVLNLALNARDAIDAEGIISIETGIKELDKDFCRKSMYDIIPGMYSCVRVCDNGCGMDAETLQHIHEPFFTTKPLGEGTGLGLASVYGAVSRHRGALLVESVVSEGTVFEICIPLSKRAESEPDQDFPQKKTDKSVNILLADDDELLRNMVSEQLESLGHNVVSAADGRTALEYFNKNKNSIDIVILDYIMPEYSGDEVFKKIRNMKSDARIILSSGYNRDKKEFSGFTDSLYVFLHKPYTLRELSNAVNSLCETL